MSNQPWHKLYPDEFDDAHITAAGAYMGNHAATGSHHEALKVAVEEAFNAGFKAGETAACESVAAGRENPDD